MGTDQVGGPILVYNGVKLKKYLKTLKPVESLLGMYEAADALLPMYLATASSSSASPEK